MTRTATLAPVLTLGVLLSLSTLAPSAWGETHVATDSTSLQAAFDAAAPGDLVLVRGGTYTEGVVLQGKSDLEIRAKGRAELVGSVQVPLQQTTGFAALAIADCENILVRGLRFSPQTPSTTGVWVKFSPNVTIERCRFEDVARDGVHADVSHGLQVLRSTFDRLGDDGIEIDDCDDVVIDRCRIREAAEDGIEFENGLRARIERNRLDAIGTVGESRDGIRLSVDSDAEGTHESIVRRNRVRGCTDDGIDIKGDDNLIERNVVIDVAGDGIDVNSTLVFVSERNVVTRNRIRDAGDNGLEVIGDDNLVERNVVKRSGTLGAMFCGDDGVLRDNLLRDAGAHGVFVTGRRHAIEGNRVLRPGLSGAVLDADDIGDGQHAVRDNVVARPGLDGIVSTSASFQDVVEDNRVRGAGRDGFAIGAAEAEVTGNRSAAAQRYGFHALAAGGIVFTSNVSKTAKLSDLMDLTGGNDYVDNVFGTETVLP